MKNHLKSFGVTLSIFCLFLMMNCKKKDSILPGVGLIGCGSNAEKLTNAANVYASDPTKANCEKYKNELRSFFKSCSTFYTGNTKKQFEEDLAEACDD